MAGEICPSWDSSTCCSIFEKLDGPFAPWFALGNSDAFEKKDHQWRWEREKELELYKGSIVERRRNKACSKRLLADSGRLMRDSRSRD